MSAKGRRNFQLAVYLRPDDARPLKERAVARGLPASIYIAALVRSHLTNQAPLPHRELTALMQAVGELRNISRHLNHIAHVMNRSAATRGPSLDELMAILKACEFLREHVKDLITTNLKAWEDGHAKTSSRH